MKKILSLLLITALFLSIYSGTGCKNLSANTSKYKIICTLTDDMVVEGIETFTYFNQDEVPHATLKFNLFGNAFRKGAKYSPINVQYQANAYPNGISYGEMSILSVKENGKDIEFLVGGEDQNVLTINLLDEVYPDASTKIEIKFTLKLADVIARTGYNKKTINLGNFYPILCPYMDGEFYECVYYANGDPFFSECADYDVSITLNKDYVVAGAGKKIAEKVSGDSITHNFKLDRARSYAMVLSKDFSVKSLTHSGVMINYFYFSDKSPDDSIEYITKSLDFFGEKFGKYAYSDYSVVETKFIQGGMEYPTLVMISDALDKDSYGEVIVHETAHQWWQTAVGNNEIEHAFLDEGLAEYSVVLFYEKYSEYNMTRQNMIKSCEQTYKTYCNVYDKIFGKTDTKMIRRLPDFDSEYEYVNLAYIKPCIMMEYLRKTIGDMRFFSALKRYYENYKYKIATPDDLVGAFEKVGSGTNGFFKSFFDGKVVL